MTKSLYLFALGLLVVPANLSACPRSSSPPQTQSLNVASTDASTISYSLSTKGSFKVTRTLSEPVPDTAVSCSVTLEGKYSRKLRYSNLLTFGTKSSLQQIVSFTAKNLPSVKPYEFRKQVIQPSLHLRVVTECVDGSDAVVLSDTTPVVARYADCGLSNAPVSMSSFVSTLMRKLSR